MKNKKKPRAGVSKDFMKYVTIRNAFDAQNVALREILAAVQDVFRHRNMNSPEPPATQEAWNRLNLAVLETERLLDKQIDNPNK